MVLPISYIPKGDKNLLGKIQSRAKADLSQAIETIRPIVKAVSERGDGAVREFTERFDKIKLDRWIYSPDELHPVVDSQTQKAFQIAKENIEAFHRRQMPQNWSETIRGNRLGVKYTPIHSVSVYAPGGKAQYPSSVLMGVIPAKIAGVSNIQLITPPSAEGVPPILAYVAKLVGVDRIITLGGAQAIAAVAYGTETIPKSEFVVGPGNSYVAAAKAYLSGLGIIGIESPAGPSEVFILADDSANPEWVACDMLSQAEHGEDSIAILATDSQSLAEKTKDEVYKALSQRLKRSEIKRSAIENNSHILVFEDFQEAIDFSNAYAPEHLEIQTKNTEQTFASIQHAGSVFLGSYSPVAMGDYISGTNHILPTAGGSRIYSSLGVDSFLKRVTFQEITKESLLELAPHLHLMSQIEGLDEEHGTSVMLRTQ